MKLIPLAGTGKGPADRFTGDVHVTPIAAPSAPAYLSAGIVHFVPGASTNWHVGRETKQARKSCPSDLMRVARRKLDQLNQAVALGDLRAPPSKRLEKLRGEREGQYSIRINDQCRVGFRWTESGAEDVEIVDYH